MAILITFAGLLMAVLSGVFLGFSDFIMRGLIKAPAGAGAEGMIGLNRTVYRSIFMVLFMGFVPVSGFIAFVGLTSVTGLAGALMLAGGLLYLFGVFGVTAGGNVPLNNMLDAMAHRAADRLSFWPDYARRWTALNHARAAASFGAAALWLIAAPLI